MVFLKFAGHDIKLSKDDRPKFEKTLPTIYTKVETDALMEHADDYMRVVISLGLKLGLREQEIEFSEWSDIDWQHKTFRVQSKPLLKFKVKDSEQRDIPMRSELIDLLKDWRKHRLKSKLILGIGKHHDRPNGHLLRWLQRVGRKARITTDVSTHKMRRTFLTTLLRGGIDLRTAQAFAGHSDLASTMRYLTPASAKEMQNKMDSIEF